MTEAGPRPSVGPGRPRSCPPRNDRGKGVSETQGWETRVGETACAKPARYSKPFLCPYSPHPKPAPHPKDRGCAFELSPCFLCSLEFDGSRSWAQLPAARVNVLKYKPDLSSPEHKTSLLSLGVKYSIIRFTGFYQIHHHHPARSRTKPASFLAFAWATTCPGTLHAPPTEFQSIPGLPYP